MAKLKLITLSGTTGVTENLYVYEYGKDIIIVDVGVGFPEPDMYGVDLVIPDFTYLIKNKKRIKAIFITHGHEDHLGALPFLFEHIKVPIYGTSLVAGFIEDKFRDYGKNIKVRIFNPDTDSIKAGVFRVTPFRISHSVPDSAGFAIDTPSGRIYHVADYKFDWTPVDKRPFDVRRLATLLSEKEALAVASDCLGSTTPGYTESERSIEKKIEDIVDGAGSGAVFFTTISSNISRMQQAINVAQRLGRKVSLTGRSIVTKAEIARNLGFLKYKDGLLIEDREAAKLPREKRLHIISGSYGQPGSALYRLAVGDHRYLKLLAEDTVIFSGDPAPPGSKQNVDFLVDELLEKGADVHYYELQEDLHVSGHGSQEDIKMLLGLVQPKFYIPIGGTVRHMRAFRKLVTQMGAPSSSVFEMMPGDVLEFEKGRAQITERIPVSEVLVDGIEVGGVGKTVLRDRKVLSTDGFVITLIQYDRKNQEIIDTPEIITRGFVFEKKSKGLLKKAEENLKAELNKRKRIEKQMVQNTSARYLEKYFQSKLGRSPMIVPVIIEV